MLLYRNWEVYNSSHLLNMYASMQAAVTDVIDDVGIRSGKVFKMTLSYCRMAFSGYRAEERRKVCCCMRVTDATRIVIIVCLCSYLENIHTQNISIDVADNDEEYASNYDEADCLCLQNLGMLPCWYAAIL